ncbi:MAG: hypothetical protein ACK5L6_09315 [Anaerorhabdus sp.]|uniref:hypothetical protein n=1 Tax=Anaerorhabdus sp. TaxID=1872524 RepID=UPI003A846097
MKIYAYLNFNGNCKDAIEFYAQVFNVEPKIMYFKDMPSDPVTVGDNFNITISGTDTEKLTMWFNQLAAGGEIIMPLEKSFLVNCMVM